MYCIDKIRTVMEDFIFKFKNCFYKKTQEGEDIQRLLDIEKLWEL
jgi:hypothetical protein